MLMSFDVEFFYYSEMNDLTRQVCFLFSLVDAEGVSEQFGEFFKHQMSQQNIQLK